MQPTFAGMKEPAEVRRVPHLSPSEAFRRTTFEWMVEQDVRHDNWPLSTPHRYLTRLFHTAREWLGHLQGAHPNLTRQSVEELAAAVMDCAAWNLSKKPAWSFSRLVAFALIRHWQAH